MKHEKIESIIILIPQVTVCHSYVVAHENFHLHSTDKVSPWTAIHSPWCSIVIIIVGTMSSRGSNIADSVRDNYSSIFHSWIILWTPDCGTNNKYIYVSFCTLFVVVICNLHRDFISIGYVLESQKLSDLSFFDCVHSKERHRHANHSWTITKQLLWHKLHGERWWQVVSIILVVIVRQSSLQPTMLHIIPADDQFEWDAELGDGGTPCQEHVHLWSGLTNP